MAEIQKQSSQMNRSIFTKKGNFSVINPTPKRNINSLQKTIFITIFINIFCIAVVIIFKKLLPPQLPLFYGLAEGESQLVPTLGLTIPSVVSLCIVTVNALLSLITKNQFLKQILIFTGLATTLLSLITTLKIFILIGNI
jgi:hypothetical protein